MSSSSFFRIFCSESKSACCGGGGPASGGGGGWDGGGPAAGGGGPAAGGGPTAGGSVGWDGGGPAAGGGGGGPAAAAVGDAWAYDVKDLPRRHSKCHIHQGAAATSHHRHDCYQHQQPILEQPIVHNHRYYIVEYRGLNQKGVARIKSSFLYYDQQSQKFTEIY